MREQASAFASVPFGVLHLDGADVASASVNYSNKAFRTLSGMDDPAGQRFLSLFAGDAVRERLSGDATYWVRNQHLNYTNVCNKGCKFCAFQVKPSEFTNSRENCCQSTSG